LREVKVEIRLLIVLKNSVVEGKVFFYKNNNNRQCLQKDLINSVHGAKVPWQRVLLLGLKCQQEELHGQNR